MAPTNLQISFLFASVAFFVDIEMLASILLCFWLCKIPYYFGEVFGWAHSLNNRIKDAPWFYLLYLVILGTAGSVVLIPGAPLVTITMFVQVVAVTLLPAVLAFLILMLNDKATMGAYVNTRWQNFANISIAVFVIAMSTLFGLSVLFPGLIAASP